MPFCAHIQGSAAHEAQVWRPTGTRVISRNRQLIVLGVLTPLLFQGKIDAQEE